MNEPTAISVGNSEFLRDDENDYVDRKGRGVATPHSTFRSAFESAFGTSSWGMLVDEARTTQQYIAATRIGLNIWQKVCSASTLHACLAAAQLRNWEPQ